MLKWLAGSRPKSPQHERVTDDPLATIKVERPLEIYAVSRVNPIFDEEDQERRKDVKPESPGKSASSGYGNSSECSSEEPKSSLLREDALTVLEQNVGFVKSILVAVSPRKLGRQTTAVSLTPIPEGKVDYCIPKPVWPRQDEMPPHQLDSILDDAMLLYTTVHSGDLAVIEVEPPDKLNPEEALRKLSLTLSNSRHVSKMSRALSSVSGTSDSSSGRHRAHSVLSGASDTCSRGHHGVKMERAHSGHSSASDTCSSGHHGVKMGRAHSVSSNTSETSSSGHHGVKMERAHSGYSSALDTSSSSHGIGSRGNDRVHSTSDSVNMDRTHIVDSGVSDTSSNSHHGVNPSHAYCILSGSSATSSDQNEMKTGHVLSILHNGKSDASDQDLLKLVRSHSIHNGTSKASSEHRGANIARTHSGPRPSASDGKRMVPSRASGNPSSGRDSSNSSGFSEVTHSPHGSFLHEDLASVRNALIYGTLGRAKGSPIGYEKLRSKNPPAAMAPAKTTTDNGLWETYCGAGVTEGDVRLKSTGDHFYYPPCTERLDFTLDGARAEQLLKKIRLAKQQRFWCRLITSLMGLFFFLVSVMVVSMLLTRGKRIFGPI